MVSRESNFVIFTDLLHLNLFGLESVFEGVS